MVQVSLSERTMANIAQRGSVLKTRRFAAS
jgi:hypothetical protein